MYTYANCQWRCRLLFLLRLRRLNEEPKTASEPRGVAVPRTTVLNGSETPGNDVVITHEDMTGTTVNRFGGGGRGEDSATVAVVLAADWSGILVMLVRTTGPACCPMRRPGALWHWFLRAVLVLTFLMLVWCRK